MQQEPSFPAAPSLLVPLGCLTATTVRSLARTLDRLAAFHRGRGGQEKDIPCVSALFVDDKRVFVRVVSGTRVSKLELVCSEWIDA